MDTNEKIGRRIRDFRTRRKYTQDELAERVGISRSYLHRMEKGENNISVRRLAEIANALDVEMRYFFDDSEEVPVSDNEKAVISYYKELEKEGIDAEKVKKWLKFVKEMND